nr:MAG TPA: hypothetical protein [Caudoviricetes sp.]
MGFAGAQFMRHSVNQCKHPFTLVSYEFQRDTQHTARGRACGACGGSGHHESHRAQGQRRCRKGQSRCRDGEDHQHGERHADTGGKHCETTQRGTECNTNRPAGHQTRDGLDQTGNGPA